MTTQFRPQVPRGRVYVRTDDDMVITTVRPGHWTLLARRGLDLLKTYARNGVGLIGLYYVRGAMSAPRHISRIEAAERFSVSTYTIARLCDEGELADLLVRGQVRITIASLEQYEERQLESRKRDLVRRRIDPSIGTSRKRLPIPALDTARARKAASRDA